MNNLNIESLFDIKDEFKPHQSGQLDIQTLFQKKDPKKFVFNSQVLLKTVRKRKEALENCYNTIYEKCCESIMAANSAGLTDIVYEVVMVYPECPEYSASDCVSIIQKKLNAECIQTIILSATSLFISWDGIENDPRLRKKY
jgi:hypothetical protein